MKLECRKELCCAAVLFLFLFVTVGAHVPNCVKRFGRCECHAKNPTYIDLSKLNYSTNVSDSPNCIRFCSNSLSWEDANNRCQSQFSNLWYLVDKRSVTEARKRGFDLVWLGIRRMAGFYVSLSSKYPLFKILQKDFVWSAEDKVPLHDCVALNTSTQSNGKLVLITKPCDTKIPFICQNDGFPTQLVKSLACPANGYFVYQSPLKNPQCTESETIHFDMNVTETIPANQNISLRAEIKTTHTPSSLLTCSVFSGDSPLNLNDSRSAVVQWFKDGIPVSPKEHDYFQIAFYPDPLKILSGKLPQQGEYSCGVYLPGFSNMLKSEEVDYFFSNNTIYLLVLEGPKDFIKYRDFSMGLNFTGINKSMNMFSSFVFNNSVAWDFQNASLISDQDVRLTLLLYTASDDGHLFDVIRDSARMRELWRDYVEEKGGWPITSLETYIADTCLEERDFTSGQEWIWKKSKTTRFGVSEPMCLNGQKLATRRCKASLIDGARWMPFDYTKCTESQPRFQDEPPMCSEANSTPTPNLCYSVHRKEASFSEALDICHSSSGYLMDSNFFSKYSKIFESLDSQKYWISTIPEETKPEGEYILSIKDASFLGKGLSCTGVSLSDKSFTSEDCQRKLPFICMQTVRTPTSSILYSHLWHHLPDYDSGSCYSFYDDKLRWEEAEQMCRHSPSTSLLNIEDEREYRILRLIMSSLKAIGEGSWWMGLKEQNGNSFHWSGGARPTFVDWSRYTNFGISPSAAGVLNKSEDAVEWILKDPSEKIKFVCEMRDCKDTRPNHVYLDDILPPSVPDDSVVLLSFQLQCSWSGWFVSETVSWFKDGVRLLDSSPVDQLHMKVEVDRRSLLESHLRNFQGYYWCSLRGLSGTVEESSKLLKKVSGFTTFVIKVVSEIQNSGIISSCLFLRSESIKETFRMFNGTIPSEGILHNVTCNSTQVVYYAYLYATHEMLWEVFEAEAKKLISSTDTLYGKVANYSASIRQIEVRSTSFCPEERVVSDGTIITWPSKEMGGSCTAQENYVSENGEEVERQCLGDFYSGAYWGPMPEGRVVSTKDATLTLSTLAKTKMNKENVLNYSQNLEHLTAKQESLTKEDVRHIAKILRNIGEVPVIQPEVLPPVLNTVDSIIESGPTTEVGGSIQNRMSTAVNTIISRLPPTRVPVKTATPHLSLSILPLSKGRTPIGGALEVWNSKVTTLFEPEDLEGRNKAPLASILLPEKLVREVRERSNESSPLVIQSMATFYGERTASPIIQASFVNYSAPMVRLYPRVQIEFEMPEEQCGVRGTFQCVFWDHHLNDGSGGWSYKGCTSEVLNTSRVLCSCDHLTAFSLLFDFDDITPKDHALALDVITYVGCTLSIIGLVLTMLTFCLFRSFRKRTQLKALFNLSLSLSLFLVLFLAGFIKRECASEWLCLGIGLLLHYLLLATFAWMVVEAYLQYLSLVKVFGTYIPRFIQKAMLFAWGVPLVAVVSVLSVDHTLYYSGKYCWVGKAEAFFYAVAMPILLMLGANFVIFGLILYANTCGREKLRSNQNQRQETLTRARAIFSVSILLGLSWIFGFLSLISEDLKLLFSYLFALTTTSQGFFIFIFYVFRHHSVRRLWLGLVLPQNYSTDVSRCSTELLKTNHVSSNAVFSKEEKPYVHFNFNFS